MTNEKVEKLQGLIIAVAEGRATVPLDEETPECLRVVQKLRQVADQARMDLERLRSSTN
jgi:hypothetical protein